MKRLARRGTAGLGRLGSILADGSGDIFIAFSTANPGVDDGNWHAAADKPATLSRLPNAAINPLFTATIEGVEEAVINAMIAAKTMTGVDYWTVSALPHKPLQDVLRRHNLLVAPK
jgi:L-aminopeptidase/D-esterase-like protein